LLFWEKKHTGPTQGIEHVKEIRDPSLANVWSEGINFSNAKAVSTIVRMAPGG
jgi:hypothetical protein